MNIVIWWDHQLMDFCLKVGSEVETLFKYIIRTEKFKDRTKNDEKSINRYGVIIESVYHLSEYEIIVNPIKKKIKPFKWIENENGTITLEWFKIYSEYKHDKLYLIDKWNLKHSLNALGCLFLLVINHPTLDGKIFYLKNFETDLFNLAGSNQDYFIFD